MIFLLFFPWLAPTLQLRSFFSILISFSSPFTHRGAPSFGKTAGDPTPVKACLFAGVVGSEFFFFSLERHLCSRSLLLRFPSTDSFFDRVSEFADYRMYSYLPRVTIAQRIPGSPPLYFSHKSIHSRFVFRPSPPFYPPLSRVPNAMARAESASISRPQDNLASFSCDYISPPPYFL